jgi:divalent metal cation (Fe/Co/Zn/Cd) transporter
MLQETLPALPGDGDRARALLVRRGLALTFATLTLVSLEAGVSLSASVAAGSVALLGYGVDSVIEFISGVAALWRLAADRQRASRARAEQLSHRLIGFCFLALAVYVLVDAIVTIVRRNAPHPSLLGVAVAMFSLLTMPLLARAKRRVAAGLDSSALASDAAQSSLCAYLSAILLGGLVLNALFGWWWADPVAALAMLPIIVNEGVQALRGRSCSDGCCTPGGTA